MGPIVLTTSNYFSAYLGRGRRKRIGIRRRKTTAKGGKRAECLSVQPHPDNTNYPFQ